MGYIRRFVGFEVRGGWVMEEGFGGPVNPLLPYLYVS
jgi:hypothetical protein